MLEYYEGIAQIANSEPVLNEVEKQVVNHRQVDSYLVQRVLIAKALLDKRLEEWNETKTEKRL
jgi:hypothetical protein